MGSRGLSFGPERADLGSERADLGPESRPERLYWVLVLGLQYSCVLGFPNTCSLFCYFSNTIQYYTILQKADLRKVKYMRERLKEMKRKRKSIPRSEGEQKKWR